MHSQAALKALQKMHLSHCQVLKFAQKPLHVVTMHNSIIGRLRERRKLESHNSRLPFPAVQLSMAFKKAAVLIEVSKTVVDASYTRSKSPFTNPGRVQLFSLGLFPAAAANDARGSGFVSPIGLQESLSLNELEERLSRDLLHLGASEERGASQRA